MAASTSTPITLTGIHVGSALLCFSGANSLLACCELVVSAPASALPVGSRVVAPAGLFVAEGLGVPDAVACEDAARDVGDAFCIPFFVGLLRGFWLELRLGFWLDLARVAACGTAEPSEVPGLFVALGPLLGRAVVAFGFAGGFGLGLVAGFGLVTGFGFGVFFTTGGPTAGLR